MARLMHFEQELGIINPDFCRERLDSALLASIGLISDKASLDKKEIRTKTGLLCVSFFHFPFGPWLMIQHPQLQAKQIQPFPRTVRGL